MILSINRGNSGGRPEHCLSGVLMAGINTLCSMDGGCIPMVTTKVVSARIE